MFEHWVAGSAPRCDRVGNEWLRAECHFQVLEAAADALDPATYAAACAERAGQFAASCPDHGLCAWVDGLVGDGEPWFSPGAVDAQLAAVETSGLRSPVSGQLAWMLRAHAGAARDGRRLGAPLTPSAG